VQQQHRGAGPRAFGVRGKGDTVSCEPDGHGFLLDRA
jgi:hypothetical protein